MPSIHTNSVREELDRIKAEFASQSEAGKVPSESAMLIKSLMVLIELLFSIFLESNSDDSYILNVLLPICALILIFDK